MAADLPIEMWRVEQYAALRTTEQKATNDALVLLECGNGRGSIGEFAVGGILAGHLVGSTPLPRVGRVLEVVVPETLFRTTDLLVKVGLTMATPPLPSVSRYLLIAAAGVSVGLASLAALTASGTEYWQQILHEVFQALTGAALTVALGGGVVAWWQRRRFRQQTQNVAFGLLDGASHAVRMIGLLSLSILDETEDDTISSRMNLPWSKIKNTELQQLQGRIKERTLVLIKEVSENLRSRSEEQVSDRVARTSQMVPALRDHLGALRSATTELGFHSGDDSLKHYQELSRLTREVDDLEQGAVTARRQPGVGDLLLSLQVGSIVSQCGTLMNVLDVTYWRLRPVVASDSPLETNLRAREEAEAAADKTSQELLHAHEEADRISAEADQALAAFMESASELRRLLSQEHQGDGDSIGSTG